MYLLLRRQAFNAILFLYEQVLNISLKDQNIQALRAKERKHIPVVLTIKEELKVQVEKVKETHQKDLNDGYGSVYIPYALERKFPKAKFETKWQYIFPMNKISKVANSSCEANFL